MDKPFPGFDHYAHYLVKHSGGKDSNATLLWALEHLDPDKIVVVWNDSGADWPETPDYLDYLEHHLQITITRLRALDYPALHPRKKPNQYELGNCRSVQEMVRHVGRWPYYKSPDCVDWLKAAPTRRFATAHKLQPYLMLMGQRREESRRRASMTPFAVLQRSYHVYRPVLDYTLDDVLNLHKRHNLQLHPIYDLFDRQACWICPFQKIGQFLTIHQHYPNLAQQILDIEAEIDRPWHRDTWARDLLP